MSNRLANERQFHDAQAAERRQTFDREPHRLRFRDDDYLDHECWVRPAFIQLGDVYGKSVLDLGCGHGMASVVLARRHAIVTACDLSAGFVAETRRRALANDVPISTVVADGHSLPFADHSFDTIWGHAILHHLDIKQAAAEIRRVLKPSGIAVFCEPLNGNPLLRLARRWRIHTDAERPLAVANIQSLRSAFARVKWSGYQLFGMIDRRLNVLDTVSLAFVPMMQRFSRYAIIKLH